MKTEYQNFPDCISNGVIATAGGMTILFFLSIYISLRQVIPYEAMISPSVYNYTILCESFQHLSAVSLAACTALPPRPTSKVYYYISLAHDSQTTLLQPLHSAVLSYMSETLRNYSNFHHGPSQQTAVITQRIVPSLNWINFMTDNSRHCSITASTIRSPDFPLDHLSTPDVMSDCSPHSCLSLHISLYVPPHTCKSFRFSNETEADEKFAGRLKGAEGETVSLFTKGRGIVIALPFAAADDNDSRTNNTKFSESITSISTAMLNQIPTSLSTAASTLAFIMHAAEAYRRHCLHRQQYPEVPISSETAARSKRIGDILISIHQTLTQSRQTARTTEPSGHADDGNVPELRILAAEAYSLSMLLDTDPAMIPAKVFPLIQQASLLAPFWAPLLIPLIRAARSRRV